LFSAGYAVASEDQSGGPSCTCPDAQGKSSRPKFAEIRGQLDEADEIAALESVQLALSRAGDGTTFVWRRNNGRLSGLVNPTSSFRNGEGAICRHIVVLLTTGLLTKKTEGVACRLPNGRWRLDG
jgi:surface antigen